MAGSFFSGSRLAATLLSAWRAVPQEPELLACDLASPAEVAGALSVASPNLIIHAAGSLLIADPACAVAGYANNLLGQRPTAQALLSGRA